MAAPYMAQLEQQVDPKICPPEHVIDWRSPLVSADDLVLINHANGLISGYAEGPEETRIAVGLETLQQLENRKKAVDAVIAASNPAFRQAVAFFGNPDKELTDAISSSGFDSREDVVPAILELYSGERPTSTLMERILKREGKDQAAYDEAMRRGLFYHLDLALFTAVGGLLKARHAKQDSPQARVEVKGGSSEVSGRLIGLNMDREGKVFLEIGRDDNSSRRKSVNCVLIESVAIVAAEEPPAPPESA